MSKRELIFERPAKLDGGTREFDLIVCLDLDITTSRHPVVYLERLIPKREVDSSVDKLIESIRPFDSSYKFVNEVLERRTD